MDFDVIPFDDIKWGQRLGAGSFGSVHKGTYLGIDIAIKEVLPSTEYDVHKYFEREWRIMRECRHPNIVLFLGLSRAPEGDDRIFIVSEFVPRGNLRQFILSSYAFPWRLRLSFATDVARAVAYLHARQCIHRDLKGENLLITSNERVKVTDFGFARIASRNAEEMRRMTYCGTDGYMSPEIINGQEFDLPTDVFSLGIIFIEIMCRRLVDSKNFVRQAPSWTPDPVEIKKRLSLGCPPDFLSLALHCCAEKAPERPKMAEVLDRLRAIEVNVLSRLDPTEGEHVGSIKLVRTGKRAMPIFDAPTLAENVEKEQAPDHAPVDEGEESDAHIEEEALVALAGLQIDGQGATPARKGHQPRAGHATWRTARWKEAGSELSQYSQYTDASEMRGHQRLLATDATGSSITSAPHESVESGLGDPVRSASMLVAATPPISGDAAAASTMTIRGPTPPEELPGSTEPSVDDLPPASQIGTIPSLASSDLLTKLASALVDPTTALHTGTSETSGEQQVPVLQTRYQKEQERKAQVGALGTHRFTLVGKEEPVPGKKPSSFTSTFAFAFLPKVMSSASKCPVCGKKIGQRAALQCDDCSVHVKCSHAAPRNCASPATQG